ncbi:hypothetical protein F4801DRAFT_552593 [Xylaria longipes]|nr:hypothetical protein F4801DRAFT_552593 [Xylaria longipes]
MIRMPLFLSSAALFSRNTQSQWKMLEERLSPATTLQSRVWTAPECPFDMATSNEAAGIRYAFAVQIHIPVRSRLLHGISSSYKKVTDFQNPSNLLGISSIDNV